MNAQTPSMPVPHTGAGASRGSLKPRVPPDLACSHFTHWQQGFSPRLDCKEHPVGDSVASPMTEGSKVTWTARGPAHSTITSVPRRGQRQSPRGQQGHESRGLASAVLGTLSHIQAGGWVCR